MSELPPGHREMRYMVLSCFSEGGLDACNKMLGRLTSEVECLGILAGEAGKLSNETVMDDHSLTRDEQISRFEMVLDIDRQRQNTVDERNYVCQIIGEIADSVVERIEIQ